MKRSLVASFLITAFLLILQTSHSFAQSGNVVITSDTTWPSGTYNLSSLKVTNNARLLLQGADTTGKVGGLWQGKGVTIVSASIEVDPGSSISADGQGYTGGATAHPGNGPGGGCGTDLYDSAGGSYGGLGWGPASCPPGPVYGSALTPADPGSGGGGTTTTSGGGGYGDHVGGDGGGAIRLIVSGTLTNNGTISANGTSGIGLWPPGLDNYAGGGSGGSIWVTAGVLTGSGNFTANGAPRYWGAPTWPSGGGGRIAVYYGADGSFTGFDSSTANGAPAAQQGTVAFIDSSQNDLLVTGAQRFIYSQDSAITFHNITVRGGASLTVGGNSTITVTGTILVTENSKIILEGKNRNASTGGLGVTVTAANVQVDSGSSINANGQGYTGGATGQPGNGPGGGCGTLGFDSAGGSYGGRGYGTPTCSSGPTYGSAQYPTDFGSGGGGTTTTSGGSGTGDHVGGDGGGAIRMIVTGTILNNGAISANGSSGLALWPPSLDCYAGGGSGGSLWITVGTLSGSGVFSADGGPRYWGAPTDPSGGGGRVAIYYSSNTFGGAITADKGSAGSEDGTVNLVSTIVNITIRTNPSGRSFTVDGTGYSSTQTFNWEMGSNHSISTSSLQAGATGTRYVFTNWSDGGALSHSITAPESTTTYTATFKTQYRLTTTPSPTAGGTIAASPSSSDGYYDSGTSVQLTATANSGYAFANWSGDLSGTTNPQNATLSAPRSVTANFNAVVMTSITIGTNPEGRSFTVDGTAYTNTQTFSWEEGSVHTIATSTPQAGLTGTRYRFANWSDGGSLSHSVTTPGSARTYTANFTTQYQLTVLATPLVGGSVAATPASADGFYDSGTSVQLTASSNSGFAFSDWSGDLSGTANPQSLILSAPRSVTANFSALAGVAVIVSTNPAGRSFTVDGVAYTTTQNFIWTEGSSHTISTTSPQTSSGTRYQFAAWSDGGAISHSINVPATTTTYTAGFTVQYRLTTSASPANGGHVNANPASSDGYYASGTAVQLTAGENSGYFFSSWSGDLSGMANPQTVTMSVPRSITANFMPKGVSVNLTLSRGAAAAAGTAGTGEAVRVGYSTLTLNSGVDPYGTAVFSFMQSGITVTEAGVPASPPTTRARIFIDYREAVDAVPGRSGSGIIDINTGIVVVNYGSAAANATYTLRDMEGTIIATGHGEPLNPGNHFACFIHELKDRAAPDFNLPPDFQNTTQFGSLEIASDQPVSVLGLRGTYNQRDEFLITTTPVADLIQPFINSSIYFPQFVDGGGYTTSLILLNTSGVTETGSLQIMDKFGAPFVVQQAGGAAGSSFMYSIQPHGVYRFQTDGSPTDVKAGWVRLTPDSGKSTPVGSGVFGFNPLNILVSESGIPSAVSTTHARVYVDLSGKHNTGLAIANTADTSAEIALKAYQSDGVTEIGASQDIPPLDAHGHTAAFANEFISGLPAGFNGVLDISSTAPFAALTLRSLYNERDDFLMTTFPVADANRPAPSPIVFPQIVDGGGYITQFFFISPSGESSATLHFRDEEGEPMPVGR